MTQNIRWLGFLKLAVGALIFAGVAHYFMRHGLRAGLNPFLIIIPAMPGCFALVGLVELVTGAPETCGPSSPRNDADPHRLGADLVALIEGMGSRSPAPPPPPRCPYRWPGDAAASRKGPLASVVQGSEA